MLNFRGVVAAFLYFTFGIIMLYLDYYLVPSLIDALPNDPLLKYLAWAGFLSVTIAALVVMPWISILEDTRNPEQTS